ncbi:MAG: PAS domain-containing protein [Desulfosudis oleivorans]|nr:PAS domain-containing protein [Desulfosudis oleivorans]
MILVKKLLNTTISNQLVTEHIKFLDGRIFEFYTKPFFDEGNNIVGRIWSFRDETDRKSFEEKTVFESEIEKSVILNNVSEMITFQDTDLKFKWVNKAASDYIGQPSDELITKYCYDVWQGKKCLIAHNCPVIRAIKTGKVQKDEVHSADGKYWMASAIPTFDKNNNITGVVQTFREITEQKKVEQNLIKAKELAEDASRAKSEFLANMSHVK